MSLKIITAEEAIRVERLNLCIYAQPGVGKTTLGFTADKPMLLDFDKGAVRAANRKTIAKIDSWADVSQISASDMEGRNTIIMDTAGRALDILSTDIIAKNPKMGKGGGALSLQGYGELKVRFAAFLKLLNSFGKDVVLICHMSEERNGDDVIERLDAQGSSKGEIYKSVDAMGRIFVRGNKRFLDFSPREGSFGKNPGQLPELEIPHPSQNDHFLGDVIQQIKDKLNAMSDEQRAAQKESDEWAQTITDLSTPDDFNRLLEQIKKLPKATQSAFAAKAKTLGFEYDKATKHYFKPEAVHAAD